MSSLLVVNSQLFPALYNYSEFAHLNQEKGEEAAVTSNGHSGESSSHMSGKEVSRWQSFAVGGHRERGVRGRSEAWLLMGERGGEA